MKKNNILRFTALAAALTLTFGSFTSCSDKKGGSKSSSSSNSKDMLANSYKATPLDIEGDFSYVNSIFRLTGKDKIFMSAFDYEANTPYFYMSDLKLSDVKKLDIDLEIPEGSECNIQPCSTENGNVALIVALSDYGDFEIPDFDSPDFNYEDFDYEAYEAARHTVYRIVCLDENGSVVSDNELKDYEKYTGNENNELYINYLIGTGDNKIAAVLSGQEESSVITLNTDGKVENSAVLQGISWVEGIGNSSDGNLMLIGYSQQNGELMKRLDKNTLKPIGEDIKSDSISSGMYGNCSLFAGSGDYLAYMSSSAAYSGIKEDGTVEEIINWTDADLSTSGNVYIVPIENDEFIAYENDYQGNSGFYHLTKRDASELENTSVVTIATLYDDPSINTKIKDFNKSHENIRVKAINYGKYDEYDEQTGEVLSSGLNQLQLDIIAGNAPDMIASYNTSIISTFASKDVYADLYSFMEKDSELSKDKLLDNILKIGEYNGKLLSLSPTFSIATYVAKTKFCDKENWSFDDLKKTYETMPKDMKLQELASNEAIFSLLVSASDSMIDYEKATCNFDSKEFIDILDFCKQFPNTEEIIDWDNASDEEMQAYYDEIQTMYMDDKGLLYNLYISDFRNYAQTKQATFGNDDITLVGFPTSSGSGARILPDQTFAILNSSSNKESCWSFIKEFFTEDSFDNTSIYGFPALVSAFEKKADEAMNKPYYIDENGKKQEYDDTWFINDKEIKINPLTPEEKEYIVNYVKSASEMYNMYSEEVNQILENEVKAFFKGERSAEDTAKQIQSKVGLLLAEKS